MKNKILLKTLLVLMIAFSATSLRAQSISGNIKGFESAASLGFATVDIYKADKLVASVLTDASGNFNVSLDTGLYRCEIQYAGYHKVTQEFKVTDDEKAIINLKKDKESRYKAPSVDDEEIYEKSEISRGYYAEPDMMMDYDGSGAAEGEVYRDKLFIRPPGDEGGPQVGSGVLTAGEVNDFSKWDLWSDLTEGDLATYRSQWDISPSGRYMIEVTNQNGLPLSDAKLKLVLGSKVIFSSRTDNTGKAELWAAHRVQSTAAEDLEILIEYKGDEKKIKRPKKFGDGFNRVSFRADCEQSQLVDIAFVVDATGSMGDELNFLKAELNDVIYKSKSISNSLNFRFANVFYRDHGDAYVTRSMQFSRVLSEAVSFISEQSANGGGDNPEAVEIALDSAINNLDWSTDARARILFLVLDAPPHQTPEIKTKMIKLMKDAAEKGIRVVPVTASGIGKGTEYLMRSMALLTNGTYTFLTDHSGVGGSHIEPSTDSYDVEKLNDLLVRVIKSFTYMPDCEQNVPELDLPYSDSVVVIPTVNDSVASDSGDSEPSIESQLRWSFYPNPTRGLVNIKANVDIEELHVTDLSGKILRRLDHIKADRVVQTDLNGFASGIYLIRYPVGEKWVSGKVVLIK